MLFYGKTHHAIIIFLVRQTHRHAIIILALRVGGIERGRCVRLCNFDMHIVMLSSSCDFDRHMVGMLSSSCEFYMHIGMLSQLDVD